MNQDGTRQSYFFYLVKFFLFYLSDGRTLNRPAGKPASCASWPSASAVKGVSSDGFNTTEQPTASAGATLRVIIAARKEGSFFALTIY